MKIIFSLALLCTIAGSREIESNNYKPSLSVSIIYLKNDTLKLKAVLTNNSPNTISYLSMTCSWWQFYHFDKKYMQIRNMRCDSNTPTYVEITPFTNHTDILNLRLIDAVELFKDSNFKVAFEYVPVKSSDNVDELEWNRKSDSANYIWSDLITRTQ